METSVLKKVFNPSCSLMIYKPSLANKVMKLLEEESDEYGKYLTCCKDESTLVEHTQVLTVCAGCQQRFGNLENISSKSLWKVLAESKRVKFPDYKGKKMSIHDSCWMVDEEAQNAVRTLIEKMNITLVEPENTKRNTECCGLNKIDMLPIDGIVEAAKKRAAQMPQEDVIVYCVTGSNYIKVGGKTPRYLLDLLFEEKTELGEFDPHGWRERLVKYREESNK